MNKTSYNDFEFLRTLGKGAFSTVYLVRRKIDKKEYALKSIIMGKLKENEQQNSVNEIRILASISHQNVIGYKEAFWNEKNKTLNIVMEYCDDGDLETKIKIMKRNRQRFEESLIWYYTIQIIKGLKALHDKKILHRDLKSANIFLTKENNQCKIGDLNVSKVMKEKYLTNAQIGTPTYSSPEIWQNKPYSFKSDLWSVGCIIYEMCSLRPPFKGKNMEELYDSICNGKIEKISSRYSEDLWNLIKMMLEVDVNKRVDCDMILNNELVKNQIDEISHLYPEDNNNINDDSSVLDTIEYKNFRDLEKKLPNKKKYDQLAKKIKKKNNNNENVEETIKNDSSFDEFSISEQKPINNMNKNNNNIKNNSKIFKRNKNEINNILKKIENEKLFNQNLNPQKKFKSFNNLNYINIIIEDLDEYQFKKYKSQELINGKLIVSPINDTKFKKIDIFKAIEKDKKYKAKKKDKKRVYERTNHSNKIVIYPQNSNIIKSGLMVLKGDIERKISQKDLPISSIMKNPSNESRHQLSNSNPKMLKRSNIKNNSSKNVDYSGDILIKKTTFRHSLFDPEPCQKEKSKFYNQKKVLDSADNFIKMKSNEQSKNIGNKKFEKIKKNLNPKTIKIEKKNNDNLENKKSKDKINANNNKITSKNCIRNRIIISNNKNKVNDNNLIMNKNEINGEEKLKKKEKLSDKIVNKHSVGISGNLNISKKNLKSNKCVYNFTRNSKIVEIDISNNNNIYYKKNIHEIKNPFNTEQKNNNSNLLINTSQEILTSKLFNKKNIKVRLSTKNNNIKNYSNKIIKFGDI